MLNVGLKIKERRQKLGMTQDELAERTGYKSRSSINKIERGGNDLPQSKIVLFAEVLQTTPSYLMGWVESDEQNSISLHDKKVQKLMELYMSLSDEGKTMLEQQAKLLKDAKK